MNPARLAVVVLVGLVLQVSLFSRFSYDGARPDVMILLALAGGFVLGSDRGAVVGFASGLAFDILLTTPLGLSALVYTLVAYSVGAIGDSVLRSTFWIVPLVAAAGSAVGMILYAVVAEVFGQPAFSGPPLTAIVVVVSAVNAVLAPLAVRAMRWVRQSEADNRRHPYFIR
ncbi:MAG: rod shape-determining protein MreD [Acidimicrobiales bacterium]|nr:rod shape-determining protein MreD [Acidimicrobiales bacterium]